MITVKTSDEIELMKESGRIVAKCFEEIKKVLKPGIRTRYLDEVALNCMKENNAIPAFFGYNGYPANICVSVNEEVVHGIPGDTVIEESDLVSVDIGVFKNGYCGDASRSYLMPPGDDEKRKLLNTTRLALEAGIEAARAGNHVSDISSAIQDYAESYGYSVVRDLVGHGIGRKMHEDPQIPNFGKPGRGPLIKAGMTFAIEPMVNMGVFQVETLDNKWTIVTADRKPSAHFENTVAITENGPVVLTAE